jgi:cell division septal protein FtsQ
LTPKASFFKREGGLIAALLWLTMALFIGVMIVAWVASERAHPVFLDLQTGKPVAQRPHL